MKKLRLAVLISGRGSNLQALIDACKMPDFPAEIVAVISNRPDALGLERASEAGISAMIVDSDYFKSDKAGFEDSLIRTLEGFGADLICLAGFMKILSSRFLDHFKDRVINIHPSLLPKHKGLNTHERALKAGDKTHGCSVHVVTPGMDEGEIILQRALDILPDDTADSLALRVLELEHEAYVQAVRHIAQNDVIIHNGQVVWGQVNAFEGIRAAQPRQTPSHTNSQDNNNHQNDNHPMTMENAMSQTNNKATPEAEEESRNMWVYFTKLSTYAAAAAIAILVFLALFVA